MDRDTQIREAAAKAFPGSAVRHLQPLLGGMSAQIFSVDLVDADQRQQRIVARFPDEYAKKFVAYPAAYEFQTLHALLPTGLPVPAPLFLGNDFLFLEYLEGKATAAPSNPHQFVLEMAMHLSKVHQVDISEGKFEFLMENRQRFSPMDGDLNPDVREPEVLATLEKFDALPLAPFGLRHGDFWPGNLLWQADRITGIIDWENALRGPALADVSVSRLDVWWVLGREAMEEFTERYLEFNAISLEGLGYWDLRAALRPMKNLDEWAGPYAALDRPDVTHESMRSVLLDFVELGLRECYG